MVDLALARARAGGDDALAGLVVAAALDERASLGRARDGLAAFAATGSPLADDARWLRLALLPGSTPAPWPGVAVVGYEAPVDPDGLVKGFSILGPFQDTGGGIARREGPEAPGQSFTDMGASYSWGAYEVAWRRVLPAASTARGVPLDLYVHPRAESCTYLASKVSVPAARPLVLHVAATGAVRLVWDGADAAASDDVHASLVLDRLAARVDATAGDHLVAVKVCSGAIADEGRARVRVTDEAGRPVALATSSDLRGLTLPAPEQAKKSVVAGVETALERALRLDAPAPAKAGPAAKGAKKGDAAPAPGRALAVAVLRTLGGADDLRSPRAPGLLDQVARDASISPDALAMAGWVSPSGANRSGWLNLARLRARAAHDAATEAFALRRIVASHLTPSHAEWALALSREEPLASAADPEARLLRAMVLDRQGGPGVAAASRELVVALAKELGDRAPISASSELARPADRPELARDAADRLAAVAPDARGAAYVRAHRYEGAAALERAAASAVAAATSADDLAAIGRDLLDAGRYAWAREVFAYGAAVAPNRADLFDGLAAARQAILAFERRTGAAATEDPRLALAALARARDLEPADVEGKAEVSLRSGEGERREPSRGAQPDEEHLVPPAVFLARAKESPAKVGEVFDRQLHWVRAVTYHPDKRVSQLMHYSREIVIEPRTQDDLYERAIPVEGDETELVLARVHRKDGTVAPPEEQSAGGQRPTIRWPTLRAGDVVEVAVRSWTAGPVGRRGEAPFYFIDWVGSIDTQPILWNEVVVDSPDASPLAIDVLNGKADKVTIEKRGGRTLTKYVWEDPPEVPDEPLAPQLSETVPIVIGSTFASWDDFRGWYRGAVHGFAEPDAQMRALAADLTKGKRSRDDQIRALFDFVADDIRYVNYVSGEWWLPNRPQELLARRQGDCDDKAILLIGLLRSIGVEATEVLVQTRLTGQPGVLASTRAAIPLFDHGIAYLPGKNGAPGVWLDATSPQSRLGPLPSMDARARALFVDEGPARIVETPPGSPADHGVDGTWTIQLSPTGAGELTASERHVGDAAFELRMNLGEKDARAQWLEGYLAAGWFPAIRVSPEISFKPDLPGGASILEYKASSEGLARREGKELAVPLAGPMTLTSQLAPLVTRTLPVVLPPEVAPGYEARSITIVAPPGYAFADLPPGGVEAGGDFGTARLEFRRAKGRADAVVAERRLVFDQSTIPVDKYAAWRSWLQRVDRLTHQTLRLVPKGTDLAAARR
jgi:hypothetical protein